MSNFDWTDLDAHLLQMLVAVVESGSVTGAAHKLDITQSAVSHQLDKLRAITHDPLFVKAGRGVVATARAEALAGHARELIREFERFARSGEFDPAQWQTRFTIAANDFQGELLLPGLMRRLRQQAPGVTLRMIPSGVPRLDMLRSDDCQLIISPRPPEGSDILQKRLFVDRYRVFYDPRIRSAPRDMDDYLAAEHGTVLYEPQRSLDLDRLLASRGVQRHFRVLVPSFSVLPAFIRGTPLLATVPGLLARHTLADLEHVTPPLECPSLPMYMIWHLRYQQDPAHRWLRAQLEAEAADVLASQNERDKPACARLENLQKPDA